MSPAAQLFCPRVNMTKLGELSQVFKFKMASNPGAIFGGSTQNSAWKEVFLSRKIVRNHERLLIKESIRFLTSFSAANEKIDETIDKTTDFLKSISKRSLNKSETAEFLNNYAITLVDERNQGEVTYIFDENNYKRYQAGKVISEDGWRFTNLGKLRVFSGDIKLTWKFKLDKENKIVIKTKFQPIGKEYPFTYQLKDKFFEQIN